MDAGPCASHEPCLYTRYLHQTMPLLKNIPHLVQKVVSHWALHLQIIFFSRHNPPNPPILKAEIVSHEVLVGNEIELCLAFDQDHVFDSRYF